MRDRATFEKVIVFLCMALVICICWLSSSHGEEGVEINETNFPDLNFRKTVQRYFDTDKNGRLDEDECDRVVSIDYDYHSEFFYEDDDGEIIQGPSDLTGIGIFTALRELNCLGCGLTKLDLSNNTALEKLDCEYNSLTQLDVSACVKLEYLNCACNELTKRYKKMFGIIIFGL